MKDVLAVIGFILTILAIPLIEFAVLCVLVFAWVTRPKKHPYYLQGE